MLYRRRLKKKELILGPSFSDMDNFSTRNLASSREGLMQNQAPVS